MLPETYSYKACRYTQQFKWQSIGNSPILLSLSFKGVDLTVVHKVLTNKPFTVCNTKMIMS